MLDEDISIQELRILYEKETFENETWKTIEGSDEKFLISNYGRFKRIFKGRTTFILPYFVRPTVGDKATSDRNRKQFVKVKFRGIHKQYLVSRLVAYHFVNIWEESSSRWGTSKALKYKTMKFDDLIVYHKNGIQYDNYHANLEFLDRTDLAKKISKINTGSRTIVALEADNEEVIGYYNSIRAAARELYVGHSTISNALKKGINYICVGRYRFKYED